MESPVSLSMNPRSSSRSALCVSPLSSRRPETEHSISPITLGNFSKLFEQLGVSHPDPKADSDTTASLSCGTYPLRTPDGEKRLRSSGTTPKADTSFQAPSNRSPSHGQHYSADTITPVACPVDFYMPTSQTLSAVSPSGSPSYYDDSSGFEETAFLYPRAPDTPRTTPPSSAERAKAVPFLGEKHLDIEPKQNAASVDVLSTTNQLLAQFCNTTCPYNQAVLFPIALFHNQYSSYVAAPPATATSHVTHYPAAHIISSVATPEVPMVDLTEARRELLWKKLGKCISVDRTMSKLLDLPSKETHIFVDLSNIIINFRKTYKQKMHLGNVPNNMIYFNFPRFHMVLDRGREAARKELAGSVAADAAQRPKYMLDAEEQGYKLHIEERVMKKVQPRLSFTGGYSSSSSDEEVYKMGERDVDSRIHVMMLESVVDHKPGTMVLATGDAALNGTMDGFRRQAERALQKGWVVELASWQCSMSSLWTQAAWTKRWGNRFRIINLDDFVEDLAE